jgi:predicted RNase H-like nuclease (RuvC/YqgF family)
MVGGIKWRFTYSSLPLLKERLLVSDKAQLKDLEGRNSKLQSNVQSLSAQLEKKNRMVEEFKQKCWGLEGQLTSVRKVWQ